jgi:hypothetical protein
MNDSVGEYPNGEYPNALIHESGGPMGKILVSEL